MSTVTTTYKLINYSGDNKILVEVVTTVDENASTSVVETAKAAFFDSALASFVLGTLGASLAQD